MSTTSWAIVEKPVGRVSFFKGEGCNEPITYELCSVLCHLNRFTSSEKLIKKTIIVGLQTDHFLKSTGARVCEALDN